MKKRIFYIIHLDKERILVLLTVFSSLLLTSFSIGYKIGKEKAMTNTNHIELSSPSSNQDLIPIEKEETKISLSNNEIPDNETKNKNKSKQAKSTISIEELKKAEKITFNQNQTEENRESTPSIESPVKEEWKVYKKPFKSENKEHIEHKKINHTYFIQIAAFKNKEEANNLKNQLEEKGIVCSIKKTNKYYILYTTAESNEALKDKKEQLKKHKINEVIVKKINN